MAALPLNGPNLFQVLLLGGSGFLTAVVWAVTLSPAGGRLSPRVLAREQQWWRTAYDPWTGYRRLILLWFVVLGCTPVLVGAFLAYLFSFPASTMFHDYVLQPHTLGCMSLAFGAGTLLSCAWPEGRATRAVIWACAGRLGVLGAELGAWRLAMRSGVMAMYLGPGAWTPGARTQILEILSLCSGDDVASGWLFLPLTMSYLANEETYIDAASWHRLLHSSRAEVRQAAILATDRVLDPPSRILAS